MLLPFNEIMERIRGKSFDPVYFLHGEEAYFIDAVCDSLEANVLSDEEKAFNFSNLYGRDTDNRWVVDTARKYPLMAERQLIILKEAQDMKTLKELQTYIENPAPFTVLAIAYKNGRLNMTTSLGKSLLAKAVVMDSKPLPDHQLGSWIDSYMRGKERKMEEGSAGLVAASLGSDLGKVVNELEKLLLNVPPGKSITRQDIENHIGISREFNVFELQKALAAGDTLLANKIVSFFSVSGKNQTIPAISAIFAFFQKLYRFHSVRQLSEKDQIKALDLKNAYFLKDYHAAARLFPPDRLECIFSFLLEADLHAKGIGYAGETRTGEDILRRLVWKILH